MSIFLSIDFGTPGAKDTAGVRPYTGSQPTWDNTSLFLEGNGISQTQTRTGVDTTVKVRVSNSSKDPVEEVRVEAYVMNPFVGPFQPFNALRKLTGFAASIAPGSGAATSNDDHVVTCNIQDPIKGAIPWTPTMADLANSPNGHLCMVANAYSEVGGDSGPVPSTTTFQPDTDPHQGQRNLVVLRDETVKVQVFGPQGGGKVALDIHHRTDWKLGISEHWLLKSLPYITVSSKALKLVSEHSHKDVSITQNSKPLRGQIRVAGLGEADLNELARVGRDVQAAHTAYRLQRPLGLERPLSRLERPLEAKFPGRLLLDVGQDKVFMEVAVERSGDPGSLQAFDIVGRDAGGQVIGGLRILSLQT